MRQVGRGYTDLLAALLSVGLSASELQIWKEVDGVFTADPRKVPTARLIPVISPDEAAELTYYGSEVVHPFTMEQVGDIHPMQLMAEVAQVIRRRIPIRIKNVDRPGGCGTVIEPEPEAPSPVAVEFESPLTLQSQPPSTLDRGPGHPTTLEHLFVSRIAEFCSRSQLITGKRQCMLHGLSKAQAQQEGC